jgi:hypothetical protein
MSSYGMLLTSGDIPLVGRPIIGHLYAKKAGHAIHGLPIRSRGSRTDIARQRSGTATVETPVPPDRQVAGEPDQPSVIAGFPVPGSFMFFFLCVARAEGYWLGRFGEEIVGQVVAVGNLHDELWEYRG